MRLPSAMGSASKYAEEHAGKHAGTVMIVEDDQDLCEALCETAALAGYRVLSAADGEACLRELGEESVDVIVTDVQMAPMDGLTLLQNIRRRSRDLPVLLMTAYGTIDSAIAAMKNGANDYLIKPFESEVLIANLAQWLQNPAADQDVPLVAVDPVTQQVVDLARRVAPSDAAVMITGESGVGKEVFFRLIHAASSRAQRRPVAINCAAIPDNMLEAVLFGHEKGAFTGAHKAMPGKFEQAQHSTLLLDEISEMSLPLQVKLLRVLQEKQVERLGSQEMIELDVRIVATSNRDLAAEVAAGRFREDLYYRLNVFPLHIPPLRERPGDIVPLAEFLLTRAAQSLKQVIPDLAPATRGALVSHAWPGNVREMDNVMQRALVLHGGKVIEPVDLLFEESMTARETVLNEPQDEANESLGSDLKDHERRLILSALAEGQGSRKYAAEKLGLSPRTLRYKIARMRADGIDVPDA